jgi:hypothetical protein
LIDVSLARQVETPRDLATVRRRYTLASARNGKAG